jgi:hypothetical protein
MLGKYAYVGASFISDLGQWRKHLLGALKKEGPTARLGTDGDTLSQWLHILRGPCAELGLDSTLAQLVRVDKICLTNGEIRPVLRELNELRRRLVEQLKSHSFYYVPLSLVSFYNEPLSGLGSEVTDKFSKDALWHIEESGKCMALGRASASVYHFSAAIEECLRSLAGFLGIEHAPGWDGYIRAVRKRLGTPWKDKPEDWRRDEALYRSLLEDLDSLRLTIRNPSAHGEKYTDEQARRIHLNMSAFAQHVARILPSPEAQ